MITKGNNVGTSQCCPADVGVREKVFKNATDIYTPILSSI